MPVYEYKCSECGNEFELRQSFSAETQTACSKCGKVSRRKISKVPVIFKGSGWYVTDYAQKGSNMIGTTDRQDKSDKDKSESKTESKTDAAKPVASTESTSKLASDSKASASKTTE